MARSRRLERLLDDAAAQLPPGSSLHDDNVGPARYLIGPGTDITVVACVPCSSVVLVPTIPRKPVLFWTHDLCRRVWRLEPPIAVLAAASRPAGTPRAH